MEYRNRRTALPSPIPHCLRSSVHVISYSAARFPSPARTHLPYPYYLAGKRKVNLTKPWMYSFSTKNTASTAHTHGVRLAAAGDSFGDNGNTPQPLVDPVLGTATVTQDSRQWFFPYGSFTDGRRNPTGRFSNYMVQSDLVAIIMGLDVAPPAYTLTERNTWDKSGMTFATGGATVFFHAPSKRLSTLRGQVKEDTECTPMFRDDTRTPDGKVHLRLDKNRCLVYMQFK